MTRTLVAVAGLVLALLAGPPALASDSAADNAVELGPDVGRYGKVAPGRGGAVTVEGRGFGHGKGLSQYGAQRAARQGRTYRQIVNFYYPGTRWSRLGGNVSVLISANVSNATVVSARPQLRAQMVKGKASWNLAKLRPRAVRWRIAPEGPRTNRISWKARSGGWKKLRTVRGDVQFNAGGRPITLHRKGGSVSYRGILRSAAPKPGRRARDTVNVLPLDSYLKGVVPQEVPALWHPQAVRAQSVAARTYAAFERRQPLARHYQICDTDQCQVYGGHSAEHPASNRAVDATRRQILTVGGRPAFTQFSASNGGWSMAGSFAYLRARQDPWDLWPGNPYRSWTTQVSYAQLAAAWPSLGTVTGVNVVGRDGNGAWGGRVTRIRITGSKGSTTVSGDTFRSYFGLRSTLFRTT